MKVHLALASVLGISLGFLSYAQSASGEEWTGFYSGGQIGWHDVEYPTFQNVPGGILYDGSGGAFGLHAGYNHDFGSLVLGGEFSVEFPSMALALTPNGNPGPREIDLIAIMKAKFGDDAGRFLPYAVAGYARQKFDDTAGAANDEIFEGIGYGLGLDFLLAPNLVAGREAIRFELDPKGQGSSLTSKATSLSLRMSYRF